MKGLLVVTMLIVAVLIILPPGRGPEANMSSYRQAGDASVLTAVAMLFTGLRDLMYGIGETAVKIGAALWEVLPERLKPLVGLLVLGVSTLALLGAITLTGITQIWHRIAE
jgi:hypothetical protein